MLPGLEIIQTLLAPVVVISANGLLCLAFYNRLSSLVNRSRTLNKERFDLSSQMAGKTRGSRPEAADYHERRLAALDELGHRLYRRARWLRIALACLLTSVLFMLGCSLSLGMAILYNPLIWLALALFVAGLLVMMAGIVTALLELRIALETLLYEHERLEHPA